MVYESSKSKSVGIRRNIPSNSLIKGGVTRRHPEGENIYGYSATIVCFIFFSD